MEIIALDKYLNFCQTDYCIERKENHTSQLLYTCVVVTTPVSRSFLKDFKSSWHSSSIGLDETENFVLLKAIWKYFFYKRMIIFYQKFS